VISRLRGSLLTKYDYNLVQNGSVIGLSIERYIVSITINAPPNMAANNPASNAAIMAIGSFFHMTALVIIDPAGSIRRSRSHGRG
jgi:hypothetical protein